MFDIGFSELLAIGVVALVVLGPERLPKVARMAGHLIGRLQRYVATVKADIHREMELSELGKAKSAFHDAARQIEQTIHQSTQTAETEIHAVQQQLQPNVAYSAVVSPVPVETSPPAKAIENFSSLAPVTPPITSLPHALDFGIEAPRVSR